VPLVALWVGCAVGVPVGAGDDDVVTDGRASDGRLPDASIDGPPAMQTITLNQTGSQVVETGSSIACAENDANMLVVATRENSYLRVFRLADFGVNRAFTASMVSFAVEQATSLAGSQQVQVRLYSLNGALNTANMIPLSSNVVNVPDSGIATFNVPVSPPPTVQAGGTLVAEVFTPDGDPLMQGFGNVIFVGTNRMSETAPGYLMSNSCGLAQPTRYADLGNPAFANIRLILTVTGAY
jgi:hypothetical protein